MTHCLSNWVARFGACLLATLCSAGRLAGAADNWPGWRGDGNGVTRDRNLPLHWNTAANVVWKTALIGEGDSSPILWADHLFLTAASQHGQKRHILCLDARNGTLCWTTELAATRQTRTYPKSGYAPSTPVTDGKRVYAFFDTPGLICVDATDGKVLWRRDLGPFKTSYNMASSPVLCDGMVILVCDVNNDSFIIAVNCADGTTRWKTPRDTRYSSASPLAVTVGGEKQIVVNGKTIIAYSPKDGAELWRCRGMKPYVTPTAVSDGRLVYAVSGRNGPIMAIDPLGTDDITDTRVRLFLPSGGPYVPSPVLVIGLLFVPSDNGAFRFVDPVKGKVLYKGRARSGWFTSSPVAAGNTIYWAGEKGDTYVIDASGVRGRPPRARIIAVNSLNEDILASPAIAGDRLFLRTKKHLFCIAGHESRPRTVESSAGTPVESFAQLKKLYESRKGPSNDDAKALLRVETVDAIARDRSAPVPELLKEIARKDNNWNVCQEAGTQLAWYGWAARKQLLELASWRRAQPYLKILAAEGLGRIAYSDAVDALLVLAKDKDPLVRIAAVGALGRIGAAHGEKLDVILPALVSALGEEEDTVQGAAVDAMSLMPDKLGKRRKEIVADLVALAGDRNPLLAARAQATLRDSFRLSPNQIPAGR